MTAFSWYLTEVQQFDQLSLWCVEPLALNLSLKANQFDFVLLDTATRVYVTN